MNPAKCEICGREADSLLRVSHKERGKIKICSECRTREAKDLLPLCGCSCG